LPANFTSGDQSKSPSLKLSSNGLELVLFVMKGILSFLEHLAHFDIEIATFADQTNSLQQALCSLADHLIRSF
jgi:hypothetical protein